MVAPQTPTNGPTPSPSRLKRERRREKDALNLDPTKPEVLVRLEAATQAIGECKDPVRVLMNQSFMLPNGELTDVLKISQAYVYVRRARMDLLALLARPRAEMAADALAGIATAKRMAIKSGRASELLDVLDYEALQLGMPNRTTAARTMRVTPDELPKTQAGGLTDAELMQVAAQGLKKEPGDA